MRTYAARIENNTVTQAIVGNAAWAAENLGGEWVDSPTKVGIGWELHADGLRPPQPFPSWSWTDGTWRPPTPMPETEGAWEWDEDSLSWVNLTPAQ